MVASSMERIIIPVKRVPSEVATRTLMATIGSTLTLGVLAGMFLGNTLSLPFSGNPTSFLGGVGATALEQETTAGAAAPAAPKDNAVSPATTATPTNEANTKEIEAASQETASGSTFSATERAALETSITEKNIAIEQNIREIKRLKDESVLLITAFDQNCGDWNDACATTYRDTLEKNNTAYEELLVTQRALYGELAESQRALIDAE